MSLARDVQSNQSQPFPHFTHHLTLRVPSRRLPRRLTDHALDAQRYNELDLQNIPSSIRLKVTMNLTFNHYRARDCFSSFSPGYWLSLSNDCSTCEAAQLRLSAWPGMLAPAQPESRYKTEYQGGQRITGSRRICQTGNCRTEMAMRCGGRMG